MNPEQQNPNFNNSTDKIIQDINFDNFEITSETILGKQKEILEKHGHCEIYYIVDDDNKNCEKLFETLQLGLENTNPKLSETSIIAIYNTGESLVNIYQEFNKQNKHIEQTTQFIFLDGTLLENQYSFGYEVAQKIVEINEHNWKKPYFLGCSSTEGTNDIISFVLDKNSNLYLGGVTNKKLDSLVPIIAETIK